MDNMDIDSPPGITHLSPRERVLWRLTQLGVPQEYIEKEYPGLVYFVMDKLSCIPELVSAILPTDDEVREAIRESKAGHKKAVNPTMEDRCRECMVWIQWLMFLGEPNIALRNLSNIVGGRGICGAVWGNNDIAYRCRTCEHDPTCAICVPCFQNGNHKDHDYSIIYTGGGCCDCGDVTAWKREGFCSKHKGAEEIQPLPEEYANSVGPVLDALLICWKNKLVSAENICHEIVGQSERVAVSKTIANELTFAVVEMLLDFCNRTESLLSFISKRVISLVGLLDILVRAEKFLSEGVIKKLHELLLKLLGEPIFKYEFAKVFLGYYPSVVREVIKDDTDGSLNKYPLLSIFSVQIFTVPTLTPRLVKEVNLMAMLLGCLGNIFIHCAGEDGHIQFVKWVNMHEITIRVVEDIRFVMSHGVVPKHVIHDQKDILRTWMKLLSFLQGMSPLRRETDIHVEEENDNINMPFVLGHYIANIHSLLVDGAFSSSEEAAHGILCNTQNQSIVGEGDSIRHAKVGRLSVQSSVCSGTGRNTAFLYDSEVAEVKSDSVSDILIPSTVTWLTYECLRAIENWLGADNASTLSSPNTSSTPRINFLALKKTISKIRKLRGLSRSAEDCGRESLATGLRVSVDMDNTRRKDQKAMVFTEFDPAAFEDNPMEEESSTELDAFRFLSSSDWPDIIYDVSSQEVSVHIPLHRLLSLLLQKAFRKHYGNFSAATPLSAIHDDFFGRFLRGCHPYGFSAFVMEHPLRNKVFCAEVHAGMWRKHGDAASLSREWYRSVRWSEQGLELDLFLLQCCAALAPADLYVNRIVERFGLSDYLSLNPERSSKYEPVLMQEMLTVIIQIVQERRFSGLTPAENLKRELVHKLAIGDASHSQLVKSLPRDLSKLEQLQEILDAVAVYSNPSGFNQGKYSLHQTCWKELDLYHPRWNSRDLQVAEERYMRYCSISALTTQLPRWTKIYPPLESIARIATSTLLLQLIRAVLFYAAFMDKSTESRAPDSVLLPALHLLSFALDICFQQRESKVMAFDIGDSNPMLAFAGEGISEGLSSDATGQSLLSLLVSLMRKHKRENVDNILEAGNCNLSSLIETLLQKFAELDSGCMTKLLQLAPEFVIHSSQSMSRSKTNMLNSASDSEKRKAKARERQAAILAKMKAEQSKFLSSINSTADDDSHSGQEERKTDDGQDLEESAQDVCSLCHDPNSKSPVSLLILLQKSRLVSFLDRGPLSWDQVRRSDKELISVPTNRIMEQSGTNSSSSISRVISSTQFTQLVQDAVDEFAVFAQPGEVGAIVEFVKTRFSSLNLQALCASKIGNDRTSHTIEMLEKDMYITIWKEMHENNPFSNSGVDNEKFSMESGKGAESVFLGKYIAALSKEMMDHPSASESTSDKSQSDSLSELSTHNGFGPADCDGIHLSSCGHAVHQGCLDRYLLSLKERYERRIIFEGGHIVDPDQGEFLCPVCRRLANSVLPLLPGDFQKIWKQPMISTLISSHSAGPLATSGKESNSLGLQQALSLLQSAANMVKKGEILKALPLQRNEQMRPYLESLYHVLLKLYFPSNQEKFSGSTRINHYMIMWDIIKYSIVSMEIAARCGRTCITSTYGLDALYKELKSSTGFALSLLLKIVQSLRSKNPLHVLQRFRSIQLFAESVCSGVSHCPSSSYYRGGNMSCFLKHVDKEVSYPDTQFWSQAAGPVIAHDSFSSLMWVLFCLPYPFLSCEDSLLPLIQVFYVVSVTQAIITFFGKNQSKTQELGLHDCLVSDISKVLGESGWIQQYFISNYVDPSSDIRDTIRMLSFPYLRRCALLWKLLSTSVTVPFYDRDHIFNRSSHATNDIMDNINGDLVDDLNEIQELEKMFKIPSLDVVLKDQVLRSLVTKWLNHFRVEYEIFGFQPVLHSTPVVPFKLMRLPRLYQDLLPRCIKQRCIDCSNVIEEPALCLLCGKLCCPYWKSCCRESGCQTHAIACGAGTGVFLLIKRTTILLQRCARQAPWPSPYLDAFGEEDIEMHRGKPLYLNDERYAALTYMVASHGLDRSSKVLRQTSIGTFFLV